LFTIINNTITTDGELAAEVEGSNLEALFAAGVGCANRVVCTIIAFFNTISSSIATFPVTSGRTTIVVVSVTIITFLFVVNNTITHAREEAVSSAGGTLGIGIGSSKVTLFIGFLHTITTEGTVAVGTAGTWDGVIVVGTIITLLTQGGINNTITTGDMAVGITQHHTTRSQTIGNAHVTHLTHGDIKNTITTSGFGAVSSASTITVTVVDTIVTILKLPHYTITTGELAVCGTGDFRSTIGGNSPITLLSQVKDTITTHGEGAVRSARISIINQQTTAIITQLSLINHIVTTVGTFAVSSAGTWQDIRVFSTIITFLSMERVNNSITTQELAGGGAGSAIKISWVTLFTLVNKAITALRSETGSNFAFVGSIGIGQTIITLLTTVNHTITTRGLLSIPSASTWSGVRVHGTIITFLTWLNHAIVVGTVSEFGNIEVKLGEELGLGGSHVVQQGETNIGTISCLVEELSLEVSMVAIDGVLRGRVELDAGQGSTTKKVDTISAGEEEKVLASVEELDG